MKKILTVFFLIAAAASLSFAQQKYALVIGNGAYTNITRLNNPVNDANDMEAVLKGLGFSVEKVLNGNLTQMENGIVNLKRKLTGTKNSYGFFFYAGHGVQSGGENYLIPVDANIQSESFLRRYAISVQEMLDELNEAGNELNVVVLDACRDNPFPWNRSASRGLQVVGNQPADSIIVFATSAGSTARDGTGRNGLFTSHLLNNLKTPGLEVAEVFRLTMGDVVRASNSQQRPAVYNQFAGLAYLGSRPAPQPTPAPTPQPVSNDMVRINGGTFMMGSPSNEPNRDSGEVQHQVTVSSFYMGKYEVTQKEYQEVMGTNPSYFKGDNLPVEKVSWYDAVEYCNKRSQREGLTPAYTINGTNVTWNRNANGYRLPTEAEWEYTCRAGTTTPFSTGNNITTNQANYDGNYPYNNNAKGEYRSKTTTVGSFAPNAWGLYDMHGNVWEWCWDWYEGYSSGSQTDPVGAVSGTDRVNRGGGWYDWAVEARSAYRDYYTPSYRNGDIGFRLVRN
ncbi:MAG: SUMF1/EgtB/PvdO family nonheme iron enzyme [Treponema sp.]|jgi:formylglycine-generating enzyme required for sulfatase activity|nr:SUMF1/EgtB/PvdO family nonheme iron enzyme [Treponema sp.]